MFDNLQFWELVLTAFVLGITYLAKKASDLKWVKESESQLIGSIVAAAQRVKDKALIDLEAAKSPDSDGGVKITKEELSAIRQQAYLIVMDSLSGPVLSYAKKKGESFIKGLIGKAFDKMKIKV